LAPTFQAWQSADHRTLGALISAGEPGQAPTERLLLVWHAGHGPTTLALPPGGWSLRLDSARALTHANAPGGAIHTGELQLNEPGVQLLVQSLQG
ncbi:MAG: hypothetical protein KA196_09535, partial [Arenimonas sp.]|nr:hypothetical protein [Arenimonas sp.]